MTSSEVAIQNSTEPSLLKQKSKSFLFSFALPVCLAVLILFTSGYAKTTTRQGSFNSYVLYILLAVTVIFAFLFILKVPSGFYKKLMHPIKNELHKKSTTYFISIPILLFVIFLGIYFARGNEAFTIAHYVLLIIFGFCFAYCVPFKTFTKFYNRVLVFISLFSLIVFVIMLSAGETKFYSSTFVSGNEAYYRSFLGLYFRIDVGSPRNYGPFWEPGIFSLMLIIGIIFEIMQSKKTNICNIVIFSATILSTFSTSALLLLPFCIPLYFAIRKNNKGFYISTPIAILFAIAIIVLGEPSLNIPFFSKVFSKLFSDNKGGSFLTRVYSPLYGAFLGAKSYEIGFGPNVFDAKYETLSLFGNGAIEQTSTIGWIMGSFGVVGLFFVLVSFLFMFYYLKDKYNIRTAIFTIIIALIIINCEPMYAFSIFWIIFMYPMVNEIKIAFTDCKYETTLVSQVSQSNTGTKLAVSNLSWSFVIKIIALLIGLLLYPQYVKYFGNQTSITSASGDETTYGAIALGSWLVILQVLTWVLTFDIGIGNGLKNKIVEAMNSNNEKDIKKYISCSYISNFFIIAILLGIGLPIIFSIDFNSLLNVSTTVISTKTLQLAFALAFISICIEFFLKIVLNIYQALQKQLIASLVPLISTILLIMFVLSVRIESMSVALISLSIFYIFSINVPLVVITVVLFKGRFKEHKPSLKHWSLHAAKSVVAIGGIYFLIQICLLIINSINKVMISNSYGAEVVSSYEPYLKIFSAICGIASAISLPIWTLVLRADVKKDYAWIKKMEKTMILVGGVFCLGSLMAAALMQVIFDIWLGSESFSIDYFRSFMFAVWAISSIASYFVSAFSNGLKILKPQVIVLGIFSILKVPSFLLIHHLFPDVDWIILIIIDSIILFTYSSIMFLLNRKRIDRSIESENPTKE